MGRPIALALARAGADVAVSDIARPETALYVESVGLGDSPAELEETAELVRGVGRRSVAVAFDVSDAASVNAGVAAATSGLGGITILVNNAGTAVGASAFDDITSEQ